MKKIVLILLLLFSTNVFSQEFITDYDFESSINEKHAFGDSENNIVVIEFWAKFNEANAFPDWKEIKGAKYFRVDIASAPNAKKKHRIRMAPTLIVFNNGTKETTFKAGLDLECPVDLEELQEAIKEVQTANKF